MQERNDATLYILPLANSTHTFWDSSPHQQWQVIQVVGHTPALRDIDLFISATSTIEKAFMFGAFD